MTNGCALKGRGGKSISKKATLNFIQINTNKSKRATNDLVLFSQNKESIIMLVQEPYVNGKNIIPQPASELRVISHKDSSIRPRSCIYYHKCLSDKLWFMDTLTTPDCTTIQTKIDNIPTLFVSCYMDGNDSACPPQALKNVVEYAKSHNMALIIGSDVNAHNTYWHSKIADKKRTERGDALLDFIVTENLTIENVGSTPTFDNGRWANVIDLTITNAKGCSLINQWQVVVKDEDENSSDHNYITYKINCKTGFSKSKFRDINKTDWNKYRNELEKIMIETESKFKHLSSNEDLDAASEQLAKNIKTAFNSATQEVYVSNKIRAPPWETPAVREARADIKHRLKKARNTKSDKDWSELRSHQAEYHRLTSHTKSIKFKEFCRELESKSSAKRISSLIKNRKTTNLGTVRKPDGTLTENPDETLDIMTKTHFKNAPTITPHMPPTMDGATGGKILDKQHEQDLDLIFSTNRIQRALAEFDPLSAAGPDAIRPIMLQRGVTQSVMLLQT